MQCSKPWILKPEMLQMEITAVAFVIQTKHINALDE
jgi:hypothetical protein